MRSPALRFAVAALLLSGSPLTVAADSYWYIGLGTGLSYAQLYTADFNPGTCTTCTDSKEEFDVGFKGFIGYQFHRNWAFEMSYQGIGKYHYKVDNGTVTQDVVYEVAGLAYSFLPKIPFTQNFSLYGRLGGFSSKTRMTRHNDGFVPNAVSSGFQYDKFTFLTGFGAQYFFDEGSGIRLEFENFSQVGNACSTTTSNCTGRANLKMLSASLIFPF